MAAQREARTTPSPGPRSQEALRASRPRSFVSKTATACGKDGPLGVRLSARKPRRDFRLGRDWGEPPNHAGAPKRIPTPAGWGALRRPPRPAAALHLGARGELPLSPAAGGGNQEAVKGGARGGGGRRHGEPSLLGRGGSARGRAASETGNRSPRPRTRRRGRSCWSGSSSRITWVLRGPKGWVRRRPFPLNRSLEFCAPQREVRGAI